MTPMEYAHEELMEALRKWREYRELNDYLDEGEQRLIRAWDAYEKEMEGRP